VDWETKYAEEFKKAYQGILSEQTIRESIVWNIIFIKEHVPIRTGSQMNKHVNEHSNLHVNEHVDRPVDANKTMESSEYEDLVKIIEKTKWKAAQGMFIDKRNDINTTDLIAKTILSTGYSKRMALDEVKLLKLLNEFDIMNPDEESELSMENELRLGKVYRIVKFEGMVTGRFPFDCPYGIYAGKVPQFDRFVWDGKDLLMNSTIYQYEEVDLLSTRPPSVSEAELEEDLQILRNIHSTLKERHSEVTTAINHIGSMIAKFSRLGQGKMEKEVLSCDRCKGTGNIKHSPNPKLIGSIICPDCNGTGLHDKEFETKSVLCGHCGKEVKVFIKDFCRDTSPVIEPEKEPNE